MRPKSRLTRADAESLLDGGAVGAPRLEQMLAAASAPSVNEAGEELAVASFHQAGATPPTPRRRLTAMKSALAAAVTSKLVVGTAVAAAATGGIALAASHGTQDTNGPDTQTVPSSHPTASATPSPNLAGLCVAFRAGATDNNGKAIDSPAFQALVSAAGSVDQVGDYCTTLLGDAPSPAVHPTGKPTDLPSQATDHPTGKPTDLPSQASHHPTDEPTALPSQATSHPTGESPGAGSGRP